MGSISRRLNVWHRLFIVLTVLWLLFGTHYFWLSEVQADYEAAASVRGACEAMNTAARPNELRHDCWAEYSRDMTRIGAARWSLLGVTFLLTLGGAVVFWILAGIVYWTIRWILAGRRPKNEAGN